MIQSTLFRTILSFCLLSTIAWNVQGLSSEQCPVGSVPNSERTCSACPLLPNSSFLEFWERGGGNGTCPKVLASYQEYWRRGSNACFYLHRDNYLTHSPTDFAVRVSVTNGTTSPLFSNGPKLRGCPDGVLCVLFSWGRTLDGGTGQTPAALARPAAAGFVGSDVVTIATTKLGSFAALLRDGNVRVWGHQEYGGSQSSINFANDARAVSLASTAGAFAALLSDGSVVSWGKSGYGGSPPQTVPSDIAVSSDPSFAGPVISISTTQKWFAALLRDGSVRTWPGSNGFPSNLEDISQSGTSPVQAIASNPYAFVAMHKDGTVTFWGNANSGASPSTPTLAAPAVAVSSTDRAFAILLTDGSVYAQGDGVHGGQVPATLSSAASPGFEGPAVAIYGTCCAFAVLLADGSVRAFGSSTMGGGTVPSDIASASSPGLAVLTIASMQDSFIALKRDGENCNLSLRATSLALHQLTLGSRLCQHVGTIRYR